MAKISLWKKDSHLCTISEMIDNLSVYAIDIFDSLLLKTTKDIKDFHKIVYCTALEQGIISVEIGEDYYAELRVNIENSAKQRETSPKLSLILKTLNHLIQDIESFILIELKILREHCYLNPFVMSLVIELISNDVHPILINNSVYSKEDLKNLLMDLNPYFQNIEISTLDHFNISKPQLYISSNKENIIKAKKMDVTTLFYNYLNHHFDSPIDLETLYYQDNDKKFYMLRKLIESSVDSQKNFMFKIGATILGPLLSMYIITIYQDLKKENITLVLPLMREGSLLTAIFERVIDFHKDTTIEVKPLYISRKSSYLPSLSPDISPIEVFSYFEAVPISLNDFMRMFEIAFYDNMYGEYTLFLLKTDYPEIFDVYKKFFIENVKIESIQRYSKELLQKYIVDMICKHNKIATVDIGFNGTIQENIEKVLSDFGNQYNWKHYLLLTREGVLKKLFSGMRISSYINSDTFAQHRKEIIRSVDVFEQLVIGTEGTTLSYNQANNNVMPVCEKTDYSESEIRKRNSIRQGILFFTEILLLIHDKFQNNVDFNQLGYMLHRLVNYPMKKEVEEIGTLSYSSNFGSLRVQKLIKQQGMDKKKIIKALRTSYLASNICWPQGELVLQDNTFSENFIVKKDFVKFLKVIKKQLGTAKRNIGIYGAGELGSEVSRILNFLSIESICIIDKNIKLHGTFMNESEVIAPTDLPNRNIDTIIIASLTFAYQIQKDLSKIYGEKFHEIKIVKLELED